MAHQQESGPSDDTGGGSVNEVLRNLELNFTPARKQGDPELKRMVEDINAAGPLYFIRENGQVTTQGWVVQEIIPVSRPVAKGRPNEMYDILLHEQHNSDVLERYALGEFFHKRLVEKPKQP
jgi:hypothetical protein